MFRLKDIEPDANFQSKDFIQPNLKLTMFHNVVEEEQKTLRRTINVKNDKTTNANIGKTKLWLFLTWALDRDSQDLVQNVSQELAARRQFSYRYKDILYSAFCCWRWTKTKNASLLKLEEHRKLYARGINKFSEEFDWVAIIKSLRQLKAVVKMMLDDHQQTLTLFHNDNLIPLQKPQFWNSISKRCIKDLFNTNLDYTPKFDCSQEEDTRYTNEVVKFMRHYEGKHLETEDVNLFKSII